MKLFTLKLALASLALTSFAIAGCAADTTPSGDDVEDTDVSPNDLTARSAQFVGTFNWRADDSGDFVDFEQLTLKKDGTYSAKVDSGFVNPAIRCIRFPCTLLESGSWTTVKSAGTLKIKVNPTGAKPPRSYAASIDAQTNNLTLTRNGSSTVLFYSGSSCANVRCTASTHCEMKGINGGAVPVCIPNAPPPAAACFTSGCSGQVCADHSVITTCEFLPEYGCYHAAKCERQGDGQCGFTPSAALSACLANH